MSKVVEKLATKACVPFEKHGLWYHVAFFWVYVPEWRGSWTQECQVSIIPWTAKTEYPIMNDIFYKRNKYFFKSFFPKTEQHQK